MLFLLDFFCEFLGAGFGAVFAGRKPALLMRRMGLGGIDTGAGVF
jgi:sulfopyruvate decarboxylase TPP-binding subunit